MVELPVRKPKRKDYVQALILGAAVIILTPMLAGLVPDIVALQTKLAGVTIEGILAAGVVALIASLAVEKYI